MSDLDWLVRAPIAHRGLHCRADGIVENTPSAARAAIDRGFAIECDVQRTRDGEAVVFHDERLDRLTETTGRLGDRTLAELQGIALRDTTDRIMTLPEFLALIAGRVPVVIEIKSAFTGDMRLADRTVKIAREVGGPLVIKSFDPEIIARLRAEGSAIPLGIVSEADFVEDEWSMLSVDQKRSMANLLHYERSRPDFVSWRARDLPHAAPYLCRTGLGLPVMGWTIRSAEQAGHAKTWADQIIFEGFDPLAAV